MVDMVNQRKKHFAEERAKEKRNKPMAQSQLRIYMSNYLKNQGTWKLSQLKKLKFEEIKEEFDKNDDKDVPAIGEKVAEVKEEEQVKRTGKRKKQKARKGINVDKSAQEDSETDKEESVEAMNPTPLTTKSDSVANWKIFQQGQRSVYQIIRANGTDTVYMSFGAMIKDFTREDLIGGCYKLVMQKCYLELPLQNDGVRWRYYDKCETIMEVRRVWVLANHHTTNGYQFTMLNRHKGLASSKAKRFDKDFSNPFLWLMYTQNPYGNQLTIVLHLKALAIQSKGFTGQGDFKSVD
ncbi:hypothetical protein Tco_0931582 [Tanacetum coccineum]